MSEFHDTTIAQTLGLTSSQVCTVRDLLEAGATIPFIARYRKEQTGSLDEVVLSEIRDNLTRLTALDDRRRVILVSLEEQGVLSPELQQAVDSAVTLTVLEDVYLPYRPKRRTRATIAREKGLEVLAELILAQTGIDPAIEALKFINPEKEIDSADDALCGARDIIAEWVTENPRARQAMRSLFFQEGVIESNIIKGKEAGGIKYSGYFESREPVCRVPSHRMLAMLRGEHEGFLRLKIRPPQEKAVALLHKLFIKGHGIAAAQVAMAVNDAYSRLLAPSMETDMRALVKERADDEALRVFTSNLRESLMAPPLGPRNIMAIDPGFRTGCKVVCLDSQGKLLTHAVIYPSQSDARVKGAADTVRTLVANYKVEAVAIGNGTAGRETEQFIRGLDLPGKIPVVMVNESGASIYSASPIAREEFPDHDITVRGAVSIGRRLLDPLAELVKIDPKSIGVGQYQHDVDQGRLKNQLDETVMVCVNEVGVKVNSASRQLLAYVSGLTPALAKNIISHREENGPFHSRNELKKVSRLGPRAFELAAGFLRIDNAPNPLDASAVHPESYHIVDHMAQDLGCTVANLVSREELRRQIKLEDYTAKGYGLPTLMDIMAELAKPGRDPRDQFETVAYSADITSIGQLTLGMKMAGIVTNVTNFGAFVDIGVHQDGLVHISELADKFIARPSDVVKVNQRVSVTVTDVDIARKRISLSMRANVTSPGNA